jgi:hypothetical protein
MLEENSETKAHERSSFFNDMLSPLVGELNSKVILNG